MLLLSNSLPIYDEICKRSARFIGACLCSDNNLVMSVVNCGILTRCHSVARKNVMFLTRRYVWSLDLVPCAGRAAPPTFLSRRRRRFLGISALPPPTFWSARRRRSISKSQFSAGQCYKYLDRQGLLYLVS